jgi:cytochrome c553
VAAAPCVICHGNDGKGDPVRLIPSLAGQPPGYLAQQMLLFKQDTREPGDPLLAAKKAIMRVVPDNQFTELAAYYSSLR